MATLEVLASPRFPSLREGERVELTTPFVLGRRDADWSVAAYPISRQHARFDRDASDRWWALDLSTTNGTLVNGRNANPRIDLTSGDLIDVAGALLLRFADAVPPAEVPIHPELEAAIARDPLAETPWRIWTDWLLEQEHPLGTWLQARERPSIALLAQLGPLARLQTWKRLSSTWNPVGLLVRLRIPFIAPQETIHSMWMLKNLHLVPAARFLVDLEIEVLPTPLDTRPPVEALLDTLQHAWLPPSLRRVKLDGVTLNTVPSAVQRMYMRPPHAYLVARTLASLRQRCPALETTDRELVQWDVV